MPFFSKGLTGQQASSPAPVARPSIVSSGIGSFPSPMVSTGIGTGAGQGPIPSTGQLSDNPFNNSFNFQIPQPSNGSSMTPSSGSGGVSSYVPIIVVGVIIAGLGYYLFQRKK